MSNAHGVREISAPLEIQGRDSKRAAIYHAMTRFASVINEFHTVIRKILSTAGEKRSLPRVPRFFRSCDKCFDDRV